EIALYQWLIFSSVNGVEAFLQRFREKQGDEKTLSQIKIVSVGPETARAIQAAGLHCALIAKEYAAEGLIELFADHDLKGHKILLPRALKARELLPETLRRQGAEVNVAPVYQTIFPPESTLLLEDLLRCRKIDIITLTSASTANNLVENCHHPEACAQLRKITTACIGPITAAAAAAAGLRVKIVAADYTSAGLLQALIDFVASNPAPRERY
ncbi:MAG: uroporphyrinogen-III synthase, partial [Deltaproteobacteria bacterium]|nr:uroporphyrinogen-III synthase [Deltaproteobacteria bacterium]